MYVINIKKRQFVQRVPRISACDILSEANKIKSEKENARATGIEGERERVSEGGGQGPGGREITKKGRNKSGACMRETLKGGSLAARKSDKKSKDKTKRE
jgi:hypothetical protein